MSKNKRKYIDPNNPDLPDNILALEGKSWEKAIFKIEKALKTAPVSSGNFLDTSFKPDPDMEKLLLRLREEGHLDIGNYGFANEEQVDTMLKNAFNLVAQDAQLDAKETKLLNDFRDHLKDIIKPLLKVWPNETLVSMDFRGEELTQSALGSHFDLGVTKKSLMWSQRPFYNTTFYVLASFNTAATAFHDRRDVKAVKQEECYDEKGMFAWSNPKVECKPGDEWYARPWSVSLFPCNRWTHMPAAHSSPRSLDPAKPEKRFICFMAVSRL